MQLANWQVSAHVCPQLAYADLGLLSSFVRSRIRFSFTWAILFVHLLCNHFRSPDQCWVLGYRKSCCPYPSCKRWWYSPLWPGCFWKCILLSWTETSLVSPPLHILLFMPWTAKTESKALHWWCNLRRTVWPVTECLLSYAGTHGWWPTESERVRVSPLTLALEPFKLPWLWTRCVVEAVCLPPPKPGAAGTAGSTRPRSAMPSALLWLPLPSLPLWCPRVSSNNKPE